MSGFDLAPIKAEGSKAPYDEFSGRMDATPKSVPETQVLEKPLYCGPTPTTKYLCECGSDQFKVYFAAGQYETSVRCLKCDEAYIVHEG